MTPSQGKGPLIVRLCNWVGEAVLSLPTLTRLADEGYELQLIGKRWAVNLFEGHGWPVHVRPGRRLDAIAQLRALRRACVNQDPRFGKRPNMVLFTNSFSSALEARLAGLRPVGFGRDGRGWLLDRCVTTTHEGHAADHYWQLASVVLGGDPRPRPQTMGLKPSAAHVQAAAALMKDHGLAPGFVILCPFSGAADTTGKKLWPPFPELAQRLIAQGRRVVLCPGPGEEALAHAGYPGATVIERVDLGTYAALCGQAGCTVSNDTGPGHLAAAVGGHVISVLGPDAAPMWWAQGPHVTVLRPTQGWPRLDDVVRAVDRARTGQYSA